MYLKSSSFAIWILAFIILHTVGCSPQLTTSAPPKSITLEDLLLFGFTAGTNDWAHIRVGAISQGNGLSEPIFDVGGNVRNGHPFAHLIDGGDMYIDNLMLAKNPEMPGEYGTGGYSKQFQQSANLLFGAEQTFRVTGNSAKRIPAFETRMYVPLRIDAQYYQANQFLGEGKTLSSTSDVTVSWNPDNENSKDVLVYISFPEPVEYLVPIVDSLPYKEQVLAGQVFRSAFLPDSGRIILNHQQWLKDIPQHTKLKMGVARGNQKAVSIGQKSLRIYARTAAEHLVTLKE